MCSKKVEGDKTMENEKKKKGKLFYVAIGIIVIIVISIISDSLKKEDYEPDRDAKLVWPSSKLSKMIPKPETEYGEVEYDSEEYLNVSLYQVQKEAYLKYVDNCKEKGFTMAYTATDAGYSAQNKEGYQLSITYDSDEEDMDVCVNVPKEEEEVKEKNTGTKEVTAKAKKKKTTKKSKNGVSAKFKKAMDSYESFFDKYVAFMKKYKKNPSDLELIADYSDYMQQYTDTMEKFAALEDSEMTTEEALYYAEVNARITKKLAEVAE